MLRHIVDFSIRFRGVVVALAATLCVYGIYRASRAGLDIFPEFSPKAVIVQTEARGLATAQVEILVSTPIEQALAGLIGLDHVRSESIEGLSVVTAVFRDDTDLIRDRQFVAERLAVTRSTLPAAADTSVIIPLASSSATVRTIGVQSDTVSLMKLRDLVDSTLVPNIQSVPGVADVNVFGGEVRTVQIQYRPTALRYYMLGVDELATALRGAYDAGVALGFIENENQRFALQLTSPQPNLEDIRNLVVARRGTRVVTLAEVADVAFVAGPAIGAAQIGGKPAIVMMVIAQYGANTLTVSNRLRDLLSEFQRTLQPRGIRVLPDLFVPANYIEASLHNIAEHLTLGAAFVVIVLVLFLFDLRAALISALAIPLSLLTALIVLLEAGANLNIMVLGGLAIALGEVVDDAIIDTENIYRRLRENQRRGSPLTARQVILEASLEVRGSVVYASFIVALVFVPLLTLSGVAGRLFAPLGVTYILAIMASLAVALCVTPALCGLLLASRPLPRRDPPLIRFLQPHYARVLRAICRRPRVPLVATALASVAIIGILPNLGSHFLPPLREGHYILHTTGLPGTALGESIRLGSRLSAEILRLPGVQSVSQWAGRAARGADTYGAHYSEYELALTALSGAEQQWVRDQLGRLLADLPNAVAEVNTFLTERVDETITGYTAPVVVNLYGADLVTLDRLARQVATQMAGINGATGIQVRAVAHLPVIEIEPESSGLVRHGVPRQALVSVAASALGGEKVGAITYANRQVNMMLVAPPEVHQEVSALARLPVRALDGHMLPLDAVATIRQVDGRYNILHRAGQRVQSVTCQVEGRAVSGFAQDLERVLRAAINLPTGVRLEFTGAAVEQAAAREQLLVHSLLAGVGVLALIGVALGRPRHVLLVLLNLPFALIGGVLAVLITGATLSVGSLVGFVTLFGITVRNSIMLVAHYQHLVTHEGAAWSLDTVVRGATERLPSIAMTALVTALAMLPIAMNSDNPGREIMGPMAAIIIGGMASSAALNLLVMPAMMWRYGKFDARR
ncbi:MAG: efflux RND transporter permease subunit [Gammaproteobacteria bacterium]|nr:efflux RND transporter permease subunit [Gammaproteobacteria bacterium]